MLYFAYGSNMASARLRARTPRARPLAVASLAGHRLVFHKLGSDRSGKCDALATGGNDDVVHGVLFALGRGERRVLDRVEGPGYRAVTVTVDIDGAPERALTYLARAHSIREGLLPFDWYHRHVLLGAREFGLPASYVAALERQPWQADPDPRRARKQCAVHAASPGALAPGDGAGW